MINVYNGDPLPQPDEINKRLVATGGQYDGTFEWLYFSTTPQGNFVYGLVETNATVRYSPANYDFEFNPSDGKFYDSGSSYPAKWAINANATGLSVFPTTANMQTLYWYNESGDTLIFQFDNVFYVPPPPPEPVEILQSIGGSWKNQFDYLYIETTSEGRFLYGLVSSGEQNVIAGYDFEYDPSDGKFHDIGSNTPTTWSTDANGTNTSDFPTTANLETLYFYDTAPNLMFVLDNPWYVAPESGYKYLAFYGRSGSSNGWLYELELSTTDGVIDYTNPIPVNQITILGNALNSDPRWMNPSCIFDGQYTQPDTESVIFDPDLIGVLFYMENSINVEVQSGSYYTYDSPGPSAIEGGAIYGTNTDPSTFDATDESNWDFVCDLTVISETPEPPPDAVMRLVATGGYSDYDYYYFETTPSGKYLYGLVNKGQTDRLGDNWDVVFDPSDGKWYDVGGNPPHTWSQDETGTNLSNLPTAANMPVHYWYDSDGSLYFQFDNPYYVAPPEPDESQKRLVPTAGSWQGDYEYYYFETTNGQYIYGLVPKGGTVRGNVSYDFGYHPSDGKFYDIGTRNPAKWATDANGTNLSDFPTTANMESFIYLMKLARLLTSIF